MTVKKANIIVIICVLLVCSTQVLLYAAVDVNLKSSSVVDVCQNIEKREVILSINIGNVTVADKLFGYELQLKFKKGKIKFYETLKINTLSEPCKYLIDEFTDSSANIQGLMGSATTPMFGNKALVAIIGHYSGECPDTVDIEIEYFDPVEGYTNTIGTLNSTKVIAVVAQKKERYLTTQIGIDSISSKESTIEVPFKFNTNPTLDSRLNSIEYKLEFNLADRLELTGITPVSTAKIENLKGSGGVFTFDVILNGKETTHDFTMKFNSLSDTDYNGLIKIYPTRVNDCACATELTGDSVEVIHIKDSVPDTLTSVEFYLERNASDRIATNGNELFIENSSINREIKMYDINGNIVDIDCKNDADGIRIDISELLPGAYFCNFRIINNEIKRIMLIKY